MPIPTRRNLIINSTDHLQAEEHHDNLGDAYKIKPRSQPQSLTVYYDQETNRVGIVTPVEGVDLPQSKFTILNDKLVQHRVLEDYSYEDIKVGSTGIQVGITPIPRLVKKV